MDALTELLMRHRDEIWEDPPNGVRTIRAAQLARLLHEAGWRRESSAEPSERVPAVAGVQPMRLGEYLTTRRTREVMVAAADGLLLDRSGWAPGYGEEVARWLTGLAEKLADGQLITDEEYGALALANAYLRGRGKP
jgi:hypothetical protein